MKNKTKSFILIKKLNIYIFFFKYFYLFNNSIIVFS